MLDKEINRKTYFVDIDGTLCIQPDDFNETLNTKELIYLADAVEKLTKWHCQGHMIILTTARPESMRELTKVQLQNGGVVYDLLIMGIGAGPRILINDMVEGQMPKALAHNVIRNADGLQNIT